MLKLKKGDKVRFVRPARGIFDSKIKLHQIYTVNYIDPDLSNGDLVYLYEYPDYNFWAKSFDLSKDVKSHLPDFL